MIENEWIPVSERLPDKDMNVLVAYTSNDRLVAEACFNSKTKKFCENYFGQTICDYYKNVTHWMPMPLHPDDPNAVWNVETN